MTTPQQKLNEIELYYATSTQFNKRSHVAYLIARVKQLEDALGSAHHSACGCCNSSGEVREHCEKALTTLPEEK